MDLSLLHWGSFAVFSAAFGVIVAKTFYALTKKRGQVKLEQPPKLVDGWPLLAQRAPSIFALFIPIAARIRPDQSAEEQMRSLGIDPRFDGKAFLAYRLGVSVLFGLFVLTLGWLGFVAGLMPVGSVFYLGLIAGLLCFVLIRLRLWDRYQAMRMRVSREFPVFLDVLAIGLESGQNFQSALFLASQRMPMDSRIGLREQIEQMLRDIRAGKDRLSVLKLFSDRMGLDEVTQFTAALITAERQGASISAILRRQSAQLGTSRALAAERQAMKMPVKLLAPLAICIFPCTFLVLGFPIAIRLSESGLF